MRASAFFALVLILAASVSRADQFKYQGPKQEIEPAVTTYSAAELKVEVSQANLRANRTVASSGASEAGLSPQMKELRTKWLSIANRGDLERELDSLAKVYEQIDAADAKAGISKSNRYSGADKDFRFFAADALSLRCMRGLVFRSIPLAESSSFANSRLVSVLRGIALGLRIVIPEQGDVATPKAQEGDDHLATAIFDYITQPYEGAVLFSRADDLQGAIAGCANESLVAAKRISRLDFSTPIVLDNKLLTGVGTFGDDLQRYRLIGEAERHFVLGIKNLAAHYGTFARAYTLDGYFELQTDLGKLLVADVGILNWSGYKGVEGVSTEEKTKTIRQSKYAKLFRLYDDGPKWMALSGKLLTNAVQEFWISWNEVKGKGEDRDRLFNPAKFAGFERDIDGSLKAFLEFTKGPAQVQSRLTGRTTTFDLMNLYSHPPTDLKAYLPIGFDNSQPTFFANGVKVFMRDGKPATGYSSYRNYYYQLPNAWSANSWKIIFPKITNKNGSTSDVPRELRTLMQDSGGTMATAVMLPLVL